MSDTKTKDTPVQENKMGTMAVPKLLINMSLPMMISMLVQALYNVIDSMFVAQLNEEALTAVSLAFPIQSLMIAVASGTGVGINALLSRNLGEKNYTGANNAAKNGLFLGIVSCIIFAMLGGIGSHFFFTIQTDNPKIITYGTQYLTIITLCSAGIFLQITSERLLQSTGKTIYNMMTQGTGAIINIILDPILIFGWFGVPAMGVAGAAVATVLGQTIAFFLYVLVYRRKKLAVQIHPRYCKWSGQIVWKLYYIGIPAAITMALPSVLSGGLNKLVSAYGDVYVAVLGIYFKLQTFLYMPSNGIIQGMRPILSCNYGAGRRDRLWQTIACSIGAVLAIMLLGTLLCWLLPEPIMRLFDDDTQLLAIGVQALPVISMGFALSAAGVVTCGVLEALGRGIASLCLSLLRQFVLTVPLAWWLIGHLGVDAVWMALPIAEGAAFLFALFLLWRLWREAGPRAE